MAEKHPLITKQNEAQFVANNIKDIVPNPRVFSEPIAVPRKLVEQEEIMKTIFSDTSDFLNSLNEVSNDPKLQGLTRKQLVLEYITASLARYKGVVEKFELFLQGKIKFAIPGAGSELSHIAIERWTSNDDPVSHYYRAEAGDLARGGRLDEMLAQEFQRQGDTHAGSRQLAGHVSSDKRSEIVAISMVGAHVLTGVGIGDAINLRRRLGMEDGWARFSRPDAISIIHMGDAGMAEGEVKEAVDEMLIGNKSATLLVVHNNGGGISTSLEEGSVYEDPIAFLRGLEKYELLVLDVDSRNVQEVFDKAREAVIHVRSGKPAVLHFTHEPRITDHSTSDDPKMYTPPSELNKEKADDPLKFYQQYLIAHHVLTGKQIQKIDEYVHTYVRKVSEEVLKRGEESPELLYQYVYAPQYEHAPKEIGGTKTLSQPLDVIQNTREEGVHYVTEYQKEQPLTMKQHINIVLAQEMKRYPEIIVFGEDVADLTTQRFNGLTTYMEEMIEQFSANLQKRGQSELDPALAQKVMNATVLIRQGKGGEVPPEDFAWFVHIAGGKGGVFKITEFLQYLFGERVKNSRLAEASIIGTATGYAISGFVPVVEIQFDAYLSPAWQQIKDQLATLRWRSNNQFAAGMVIRVQGMNGLAGVGAMGHGENVVGQYLVPGIRHVMPADANEAGPLLREAIRIARERGEPVIFFEPINRLNIPGEGFYQGPDSHIPIGQAQIRRRGTDLTIYTYSNVVPLVEQAYKELTEEGYKVDPTIVNLRTLGAQTDWKTVEEALLSSHKALIFEHGREYEGPGAVFAAELAERFFYELDAPVTRYSARNMRTPAGLTNEEFAIMTVKKIKDAIKKMNIH